jgi:hypothetical protein
VGLQVELPKGRWKAEWVDTKTGKTTQRTELQGGQIVTLGAPAFEIDIALRIVRR